MNTQDITITKALQENSILTSSITKISQLNSLAKILIQKLEVIEISVQNSIIVEQIFNNILSQYINISESTTESSPELQLLIKFMDQNRLLNPIYKNYLQKNKTTIENI